MERNILDLLPVGVWLLDSNLHVQHANSKVEEFFGVDRRKLVGIDKRIIVTDQIQHMMEDGDSFINRILATYDRNTYSENFTCHVLPSETRQERWLEHYSHPVRIDNEIMGRAEVYFDITDRVRSERDLRQISSQFIHAQDQEKERISNLLHNQIAQSVVALRFSLELLQQMECIQTSSPCIEHVQSLISQVQEISTDISRITNDLLPPNLSTLGLAETFRWMASSYQTLYGLKISYEILGSPANRFAPVVEKAIIRLIQEGLNNTLSHANTNEVDCKLFLGQSEIAVQMVDYGTGFDPAEQCGGVGLRIVQRRVEELGGTVSVRSHKGQGTRIHAVIPVEHVTHPGSALCGEWTHPGKEPRYT